MIQEVAAVIDRSGSMSGKEADTIGGINTTIEELKKNKTSTEIIKFSVKFFDHEEYLKFRNLDIENVRPLNISDLRPRGQTALLDAMGNTITHFMEKKLLNPTSFESCIIYVATDGLENASTHYTHRKIKKLIENAKQYGIQILYLGANQDAILEANKFGLNAEQAINYSENADNTREVYRSVANAVKRVRTGNDINFTKAERQASQS